MLCNKTDLMRYYGIQIFLDLQQGYILINPSYVEHRVRLKCIQYT